jgi:hypothetical protein
VNNNTFARHLKEKAGYTVGMFGCVLFDFTCSNALTLVFGT